MLQTGSIYKVVLCSLIFLGFNSCSKEDTDSLKPLQTTFVLYVGNQSAEESQVDIVVNVDGAEKVNDTFDYSGKQTKFEWIFDSGDHEIEIMSNGGQTAYSGSFNLDGERSYGTVSYNYNSNSTIIPPRYFTFEMLR